MNWNSIDRVFMKDNGDGLSGGKKPKEPKPGPGTGPDDGDRLK